MNDRRAFIKNTMLTGLGLSLAPHLRAQPLPFPQTAELRPDSLVSIQMGPHSLFDEGIEPVLDFLKEEAAMNALMIYSHTYYGVDRKPLRVLAHDHGTPPRDLSKRNLRMSWVNHHEPAFKETIVRHQTPQADMEYHDRDLFAEILAWNYEWFQADEEIQREMYRRVKKIKPEAIVGRHVDHQRSSWDPFYRSAVSYAEMAEYADFIKPILYHDIYGPRLRYWVIERWQKLAFRDFSEEQTLEYFYEMMGYSPAARVPLDRLEVEGMGPAYVYDETKRCVDSVRGKTEVVAGIGIDVLWHGGGQQPYPSDPLRLQKAVFKAVEAGASGLLASREYDEMRFSSLRAFGAAVRQLK